LGSPAGSIKNTRHSKASFSSRCVACWRTRLVLEVIRGIRFDQLSLPPPALGEENVTGRYCTLESLAFCEAARHCESPRLICTTTHPFSSWRQLHPWKQRDCGARHFADADPALPFVNRNFNEYPPQSETLPPAPSFMLRCC
jgi:hypothetical protein